MLVILIVTFVQVHSYSQWVISSVWYCAGDEDGGLDKANKILPSNWNFIVPEVLANAIWACGKTRHHGRKCTAEKVCSCHDYQKAKREERVYSQYFLQDMPQVTQLPPNGPPQEKLPHLPEIPQLETKPLANEALRTFKIQTVTSSKSIPHFLLWIMEH